MLPGSLSDILIYARNQASAAKGMQTALFGDITQHVVAVPYRSFGITHRSHLQGSRIQEKERNCLSSFMFVTNLFNHAFIFCSYCWFVHSSLGFVNRIEKSILWNFARDGVGWGFKCRNYFCQLWNPQ